MTTDQPLGEILRDGEAVGLRYVRRLSHPPERVWRAVTEAEQMSHWLPCDVLGERAEGAELRTLFRPDVVARFDIPEDQIELPGRIVTWDPHRRFEWVWDTEVLRFDLEPTAGGTTLTVTVWLGPGPGAASVGAGYHVCLDQLLVLVETGAVQPFVDIDPTPLEARYAGLAEAAGVPAHSVS